MNDKQADRSFGALWFITYAIGVVLLGTAGLPLGGEDGNGALVLGTIGLLTGVITALGAVLLLGCRQTAVAA